MNARPLSGRRVVVTRTRDQASELAARLSSLGAEVLELPVIRISKEIALQAPALFVGCREFDDFSTAFYHSAVNFTTLGYGSRSAALTMNNLVKPRLGHDDLEPVPREGLVGD